jgi:hypothetical protein
VVDAVKFDAGYVVVVVVVEEIGPDDGTTPMPW